MARGAAAMATEEVPGSISFCLAMLKKGDQAAAQRLWAAYSHRLVSLARARLRAMHRGCADEEDVALSAFKSLLIRAERGQFPQLEDRDDLWQLLYVLTVRKSSKLKQREHAKRRGGGAVCYLSDLDEMDLERAVGAVPTPEFASHLAEECQRLLGALGEESLRNMALWKMEGYTNKEIAQKLGVIEQTVERKLRRIREIWTERGMA
jgi:DNA-directed RNA polymerase specialized sigma24 family protein